LTRGLIAVIITVIVVIGVTGLAYFYAQQSPSTAGSTTTSSRAPTVQAGASIVRIGTLRGGISSLDVILSMHLDEKYGFEVKPLLFSTTLDLANAIAHGDVDVAIIPAEFVGKLRESGSNITILAVDFYQNQAIVVKEGSGIASIADLEGRRVAVFKPTGTYAMFKAYMKTLYGIDVERDLVLVNAPPPQIVQAFQRGDVDAAVIWEPFVSRLVADYGGRILASYKQLWSLWSGHVGGNGVMIVYAARASWAARHEGLVEKLLEARSEAARLWNSNETLAIEILEKNYGLSPSASKLCWERVKMEESPGLTRVMADNIVAVWRLALEGGYLHEAPEKLARGAFWRLEG
jgi:NitT/TauT family transport system substrate-binding protein